MPEDDLRSALMTDVAEARELAQRGAEGRGVAIGPSDDFAPKAIRMAGRVVGEDQLKKSQTAIKDAVEELLSRTSITDELEQEKFRSGLTKKLNQIRLLTIQRAGQLKMEMARKGLNAEQQANTAQAWGNIMSSIGEGIVMNMGGRPPIFSGPSEAQGMRREDVLAASGGQD